MPPPSIDRIRNGFPSDQGSASRRPCSVPSDRLKLLGSLVWLRRRMASAAAPFPYREPTFVKPEPFVSPKYRRIRDQIASAPLSEFRTEQAEIGQSFVGGVDVHMRGWTQFVVEMPLELRLNHLNARLRVLKTDVLQHEWNAIANPNKVLATI